MNIPGLTDCNVEIFASDYPRCIATYGGRRIGFWELPNREIDRIRALAFADKTAMKTFREEGITDPDEITESWAWCNLGRFDTIPDIETRTGRVNLEFHNCGRRGKCKFEFRRCKRVRTSNDSLTPRETIYVQLTAYGLSDREIASRMNQKPNSMISLAQRVREKVGVDSRAGLASWATRVML